MPKSDRSTTNRRINDVGKLLVAGAEFADIRQFALAQGWTVTDRQVRRYQEIAYKRLAKVTNRDRRQLLGRHLMQRRALYARSVKGNDNRTALAVLRDEAQLQGLYAGADGKNGSMGPQYSPLTRRERTVRLLAAQAAGDRTQVGLLMHATPICTYLLPDTMMVEHLLHIMTLMYVSEQLEQAALCINAMFCDLIETDDEWDYVGNIAAYLFRIGREGWHQFTKAIGVDANFLFKENHQGTMLEQYGDKICEIAPSAEELQAKMAKAGNPQVRLKTADDNFRSWRRLFAQICPE